MSDQKLLADGTLIIPTNVDVKDVGRVILDQKGTKFCNIFYRDAGEIIYCDSCKQMDDSIGRTAAIDAVNKIAPVNTEYDCTLLDILDVRYVLTELPSAEPEIIRCKDCKHYAPEAGDDSYALGYCPFIGSHLVMSKGFCAWGERRGEQE